MTYCSYLFSRLYPHTVKIRCAENTSQLSMVFELNVDTMANFSMAIQRERERNVLFNDALNTFYLRLYGVRHMVKDHSDSEKGNPLPPHRLLLSINSKVFYMHHPTYRITHTTAFVTPVVEHWLERGNLKDTCQT